VGAETRRVLINPEMKNPSARAEMPFPGHWNLLIKFLRSGTFISEEAQASKRERV
jgi:hypothetical protein